MMKVCEPLLFIFQIAKTECFNYAGIRLIAAAEQTKGILQKDPSALKHRLRADCLGVA